MYKTKGLAPLLNQAILLYHSVAAKLRGKVSATLSSAQSSSRIYHYETAISALEGY